MVCLNKFIYLKGLEEELPCAGSFPSCLQQPGLGSPEAGIWEVSRSVMWMADSITGQDHFSPWSVLAKNWIQNLGLEPRPCHVGCGGVLIGILTAR